VVAVFAGGVWAQESSLSSWRIEVRGADSLPGSATDYTATLESFQQHISVATASLRPDDAFEFRGIDYGDYWLTITDRRNATIYHGLVTAHSGGSQTVIDLPAQQEQPRSPGGPVSIAELRHPPSRKAFAAMISSEQLAQNGQFAEAAVKLEKAVQLAPDWPQAHTNLAAEYIRLGRFEDAIIQARHAIELDKPNGIDLGNIAYAEYKLNRRAAAIESARAGLAIDPASPKLHYMLGAFLAMDRRTLPESIPHLELAAKTMAGAQVTLQEARHALR
jgi:tetratricopeptide (TPR) repeat protein